MVTGILGSTQDRCQWSNTWWNTALQKMYMEPQNHPIEKKNHRPKVGLWVQNVNFPGCMSLGLRGLTFSKLHWLQPDDQPKREIHPSQGKIQRPPFAGLNSKRLSLSQGNFVHLNNATFWVENYIYQSLLNDTPKNGKKTWRHPFLVYLLYLWVCQTHPIRCWFNSWRTFISHTIHGTGIFAYMNG